MPTSTISAKQNLQFTIPALPKSIQTTAGPIALEDLSEDTLSDIFDAMKYNAIELCKEKNEKKK